MRSSSTDSNNNNSPSPISHPPHHRTTPIFHPPHHQTTPISHPAHHQTTSQTSNVSSSSPHPPHLQTTTQTSNISSSYINNSEYKGEEKYRCGRRVVMRTSLTVKNPGRRFLGCINYKKYSDFQKTPNGCNFFARVDPKTCARGLEYAKIMQAEKYDLERQVQELKLINEGLERGKQMVEEENDALVVKLADLTETEVKALKAQIQGTKTRDFGTSYSWKMIVVVVLVIVIGVIVSKLNHAPKKETMYLP